MTIPLASGASRCGALCRQGASATHTARRTTPATKAEKVHTQGRLVPDLIVTTPLTLGVANVAERLGVPLHVMSAVPWFPSEVRLAYRPGLPATSQVHISTHTTAAFHLPPLP